jgi:hypothetical protein
MTRTLLKVSQFSILAGAILFNGCGRQMHDNAQLQSETPKSILFIYAGGHISCGKDSNGTSDSPYGMSSWKNVRDTVTQFSNAGQEVTYAISCHTNTSEVHYSYSDIGGRVNSSSINSYQQVLTQLVKDKHPDKIVIAGHSYGGWLSLKVSLALTSVLGVYDLHTIDPISRENCSVLTPFACQEFPSDITNRARQDIADQSSRWVNYFQTESSMLHSGSTSQADVNYKISASHTEIDTRNEVWDRIQESFGANKVLIAQK